MSDPDSWTPDRTDPGYLRHCVRPDCTATYNALDVMNGIDAAAGWWMLTRVILGQICPAHAGPVISGEHRARWRIWKEDGVIAQSIACACGWEWAPARYPAVHHEYQDQWAAHLASLDDAPVPAAEAGTAEATRMPRLLALPLSPFFRAAGYSGCFRCGLSTRFGPFHTTRYSGLSNCFPLCEHCWRKLGSPERRLPYYERLVFGLWSDPAGQWPAVRAAVLAEGGSDG